MFCHEYQRLLSEVYSPCSMKTYEPQRARPSLTKTATQQDDSMSSEQEKRHRDKHLRYILMFLPFKDNSSNMKQ